MNYNANKSLVTINKIIDIMTNNGRGAYVRIGDGDLNIMMGKNDMLNSFNKSSSRELKECLNIEDENFLIGVILLCNKYKLLEDRMWPGNHEWPEYRCDYFYNYMSKIIGKQLTTYYSAVAFNYYITTHSEKSIQYMTKLRNLCLNNEVIFIGNKNINKDIVELYFGDNFNFIECPIKESYNVIDNIENKLETLLKHNDIYKIVIICAGITTRCIIKRIWKNKTINCKYFLLDFGSIIDALSGLTSRQYIIDTKFNSVSYCNKFLNYIKTN